MTALPALPASFSLRHLAEIDSTNDEARRAAIAGAPHGLVIWADRQSAGRGRHGRVWQSPVGNLYFSIVLRPTGSVAAAAQLGFAAAVAICESLPDRLAPRCKWPNDVLIEGRKLAGILLESEAAGGGVAWLVVGIGVNIVTHPPVTDTPAVSLSAFDISTTPEAMLAQICKRFEAWYQAWRIEGFAPLRQAWLARAYRLGETIRVRRGAEDEWGRFVDLDSDGALVLESGQGRSHIAAGVVFPAA